MNGDALILAQQSQQDLFVKSMSDNARSSVDGTVLFQVLVGAIVLILAAVATRRYVERRKNPPKVRFHNEHKLNRELARHIPLSPADMRKLEYHAARMGVKNPLTLLLCPSLLEREGVVLKAAEEGPVGAELP